MSSEHPSPAAPSLAAGTSRTACLLGLAFLVFITAIVALVPIRADNDCWWHVKSGQYIAEHGLPTHDVLSYTAADHEWHNHEWLTQLAMYGCYALGERTGLGGWHAVILANGAVIALTYALLYLLAGRLSGNWWIALLVALLAVAIGRRMFYQRPPTVTNLLLVLQLWLLIGSSEGWWKPKLLFLLVPMIALWTNLHGGWMAGGIVLAAFTADWCWSRWKEHLPLPIEATPQPPAINLLALLLPLCLLATLANPYLWELYKLPARVLSDTSLVRSIGELAPPNFYYVIDFEFVLLGTVALALFTRRRPRLAEILLWLFFAHQAIQHVRHLSLFSIMMVPLLARLLGDFLSGARHAVASREWNPPVPVAAAALAGAMAFSWWLLLNPRETGTLTNPLSRETYPERFLRFAGGEPYVRDAFPTRLCNLVELAEPRGRMFNENHYAGYLIWRLSPEKYQTFSDPRFDIFGGTIWRQEQVISNGMIPHPAGDTIDRPFFETVLDEWDVQWLIAREGTGLAARLMAGACGDRWLPAAHWPDGGWQIWIRNVPENEDSLRRMRESAPFEMATNGEYLLES